MRSLPKPASRPEVPDWSTGSRRPSAANSSPRRCPPATAGRC